MAAVTVTSARTPLYTGTLAIVRVAVPGSQSGSSVTLSDYTVLRPGQSADVVLRAPTDAAVSRTLYGSVPLGGQPVVVDVTDSPIDDPITPPGPGGTVDLSGLLTKAAASATYQTFGVQRSLETSNPLTAAVLTAPTTASTSLIRFTWSDAAASGGGGADSYVRGTHAGSASHPYMIDFHTDAPDVALDVILKSNKGFIMVWVDGLLVVDATDLAASATLESHWYQRLTFPTRKPRHIRTLMRGVGVHGVYTTAVDSVWRPSETLYAEVLAVVGDSFTASAEDAMGRGFFVDVALKLNFDVRVSGVSGSGYVNPTGGGGQRYIDRLAAILAWQPNRVLVVGSQNDTAYGGSAVNDAAVALYSGLNPIPTYVVGPMWWPGDNPGPNSDALAAAAAGSPTVKGYLSTQGWVTGTGSAAAGEQTGTGSADVMQFALANKHPTSAGHRIMGRRIADWLAPLLGVVTAGTIPKPPTTPAPTPGFNATFSVSDRNYLGATDDGKLWTTVNSTGGSWEVAGGSARAVSASSAQFAVVDALAASGVITAKAGALGSGTGSRSGGVLLRYVDASNYVALLYRQSSTVFRYQLNKRIAGTTTGVGVSPVGITSLDGDDVVTTISGTTVTVTVNGAAAITATIAELGTTLATATKFGLYAALGAPAAETTSISMTAA